MSGRLHHSVGGNEPTPEEWRLVVAFVEDRLNAFEGLDAGGLPVAAVRSYCDEALAIQQALSDLSTEDGGHYRLPARIDSTLDANARINRFLRQMLSASEPQNRRVEERMILPMPRWREPSRHAITYTVEEYLSYLEATVSTMPSSVVPCDGQPTRLTESLSRRLIGFLSTLAGQPRRASPSVVLFLLRDTLLLCLGMRLLGRSGWPIDARGLLINRKFLDHVGERIGRGRLYVDCYNAIFVALEQTGTGFGAGYVAAYRRVLARTFGDHFTGFEDVLARLVSQSVVPVGHCIVVDNGVHGTMPLLCMATMPTITDLRMYTAVPWLQAFYGHRIHSSRSTHMREHESLLCQERLFQCQAITGDGVLVAETSDENVRREGYREIRAFLDEVARHFGPIAR